MTDTITLDLTARTTLAVDVHRLTITDALAGGAAAQIVFWNEQTNEWDHRSAKQYLPRRARPAALALPSGTVLEFGPDLEGNAIDEEVIAMAVLSARQLFAADDAAGHALQAQIDSWALPRRDRRAALQRELEHLERAIAAEDPAH